MTQAFSKTPPPHISAMSITFDQTDAVITNSPMAYSVAIGLSTALLILLTLITLSQSRKPSADTSDVLPPAGLRDQVFSTARASLRQLVNSSQILAEGYAQVSLLSNKPWP